MAFTVQIPTAFACPNDDIFSLPTKEDLTNAINKIAQVPSKLRVAIVEMGEEITEDVKKPFQKYFLHTGRKDKFVTGKKKQVMQSQNLYKSFIYTFLLRLQNSLLKSFQLV
jgi:hypothetical protein